MGAVQLTAASLFLRSQEPVNDISSASQIHLLRKMKNLPRGPKKMLGPSTVLDVPGCVKDVDGATVSNATFVSSITTGDRKVNKMSRRLVNERRGARYWLIALERPAIIVFFSQGK